MRTSGSRFLPLLLLAALGLSASTGCTARVAPSPDPDERGDAEAPIGQDAACGVAYGIDGGNPTSPEPCSPDVAIGAGAGGDGACFAAMQSDCGEQLAGCQGDCSCASLANECLAGSHPQGVVQCMYGGDTNASELLYACIYALSPCGPQAAGEDAGK